MATTASNKKQKLQQQQGQPAVRVVQPPPQPIPMQAVTDACLQHRLALGATSSHGGARGSLTRCAVRLGELAAATSSEAPSTTNALINKKEDCVRELRLLQVELTKLYVMMERMQTEISVSKNELQQLQTKRLDETALVSTLRQQSNHASSAQACQQEYESLAKLVLSRHATSESDLQNQICDIDAKLLSTKTELRQKEGEVKVRQSQFQLLLQCIMDLKQSLTEKVVVLQEDDDGEAQNEKDENDEDGADDDANNGKEKEDNNNDKMQVDDSQKESATSKQDNTTSDDALYDDL